MSAHDPSMSAEKESSRVALSHHDRFEENGKTIAHCEAKDLYKLHKVILCLLMLFSVRRIGITNDLRVLPLSQ